MERIVTHNVLYSYSSYEGLVTAFKRIDNRLSSRILAKETTSGYLPILKTQIDAIEGDFKQFFPELVTHFKAQSGLSMQEHWLK